MSVDIMLAEATARLSPEELQELRDLSNGKPDEIRLTDAVIFSLYLGMASRSQPIHRSTNFGRRDELIAKAAGVQVIG